MCRLVSAAPLRVRDCAIQAISLLVAFALLSGLAPSATARIVGTEDFSYADGPINGQTGGTGWTFEQVDEAAAPASSPSDWDSDSNIISGVLVTSVGTTAFREYNGPNEGVAADSNEREGAFRGHGTTYYRFTFSSTSPGTGHAGFSTFDFGGERTFFGQLGGESVFGMVAIGEVTVNSAMPIVANQTYTLIAEHDFDRDEIKLWVDPTFQGEANHLITGTMTFNNWNSRLRFTAGGTTAGWFDDLVVATTYVEAYNPNLNVVFADDFNRPDSSAVPGTGPDVSSGIWQQTIGPAISIAGGAIDTSGAARALFGDFTQALDAGETLLLDFETIATAGNFHGDGYSGLSLFVGGSEQLFLGDKNGPTTVWGIQGAGGFSGDSTVTDVALYGQFTYEYDTGNYELFLNGNSVLSGTATANLAFDRLRIANDGGNDMAISNVLVATSAVPEPHSLALAALGGLATLAFAWRKRHRF